MKSTVKCNDKRNCFAKKDGKCTVLTSAYEGACPFQKANRGITNGKYYPYVIKTSWSKKLQEGEAV